MTSESLKVARIIAERDGSDVGEALKLVNDTMGEIMGMIEETGDTCEAYQIWQDNTGLEPDYFINILI